MSVLTSGAKRPAISFQLVQGEEAGDYQSRTEMFKWDGCAMRPPLKGERYLSGAKVRAYLAHNDLTTPYYIGVPAIQH